MSAVLFSLATFVSTSVGGLLALWFRDRLHFLLSFSAGVLLGVVSFDILPELFKLAHETGIDSTWAMIALVFGFLFFHSLEKFVLVHHVHEADYAKHRHPQVGILSAIALVGHSFLDGVGIGLAFHVSDAIGITVAIAVIAHDFCDGLNTVSLMLVHRNTSRQSIAMLMLDAIAPIAGAAATLALSISNFVLMLYMGFFAGFLLYISASDILPEAHSLNDSATTLRLIVTTCMGAALMLIVVRVAG